MRWKNPRYGTFAMNLRTCLLGQRVVRVRNESFPIIPREGFRRLEKTIRLPFTRSRHNREQNPCTNACVTKPDHVAWSVVVLMRYVAFSRGRGLEARMAKIAVTLPVSVPD